MTSFLTFCSACTFTILVCGISQYIGPPSPLRSTRSRMNGHRVECFPIGQTNDMHVMLHRIVIQIFHPSPLFLVRKRGPFYIGNNPFKYPCRLGLRPEGMTRWPFLNAHTRTLRVRTVFILYHQHSPKTNKNSAITGDSDDFGSVAFSESIQRPWYALHLLWPHRLRESTYRTLRKRSCCCKYRVDINR